MTPAGPNLHPVDLVIDRLRDAGCQPKASRPGQYNAKCPVAAGHRNGDKNPSLSVGTGPDGKALVHCNTGCKLPDVAHALNLHVNDLFPDKPHATIDQGKRIVATYDYYDADGTLIFQVVRYRPKGFSQRKPDGRGGWDWNPLPIGSPGSYTKTTPGDACNVNRGSRRLSRRHLK